MHHHRRILRPLAAGLLLALSGLAQADRYTIVDLGARRFPYAVNTHGDVVGFGGGGTTRAARWKNGRWRALGSEGSYAIGLNGRGDAVGQDGGVPVLWPQGGGARPIALPDGSRRGQANDIAQDGTVVGYHYPGDAGSDYRCFLTGPDGIPRDLGTIGSGTICGAAGVNGLHQVAGWAATVQGGLPQAFRWQDGQFQLLGNLPGATASAAQGINLQGDVVGSSGGRGFVWSRGTMVDIGTDPLYTVSQPLAINDAGEIVGEARGLDGRIRAVRFAEGRIIDLAGEVDGLPADWTLDTARGISQAGVIVGQGTRVDVRGGRQRVLVHGFLLVPLAGAGVPADAHD